MNMNPRIWFEAQRPKSMKSLAPPFPVGEGRDYIGARHHFNEQAANFL
jgi:hypothetical protein